MINAFVFLMRDGKIRMGACALIEGKKMPIDLKHWKKTKTTKVMTGKHTNVRVAATRKTGSVMHNHHKGSVGIGPILIKN